MLTEGWVRKEASNFILTDDTDQEWTLQGPNLGALTGQRVQIQVRDIDLNGRIIYVKKWRIIPQ